MTKKIYEFIVKKEEEVDKIETRNENGKEVTITSKVKENIARKFFIKSQLELYLKKLNYFMQLDYQKELRLDCSRDHFLLKDTPTMVVH